MPLLSYLFHSFKFGIVTCIKPICHLYVLNFLKKFAKISTKSKTCKTASVVRNFHCHLHGNRLLDLVRRLVFFLYLPQGRL